ncbi:ECF transporter S component [Romboutsia ilealis]|uniref:ECF transporter S component n=2 Tax=Romboutsia faecis TaxID=2764597 RepID=A0ABR7JKU9_9FIRM|nr:ECF transporter S component [Romboutsia faecis]MRN23745.1 ECF transporter S component [Romboutsia ilealis]
MLVICIAVNIILGTLVQTLNIPLLFLDTVGTIFGSITLGPFFGALIGGCSNIILGIISNPTSISYAFANIALGFIVGFVSKKRRFDYKQACVVGLILAVICPLISTPISLYLYGYESVYNSGSDLLLKVISQSGKIIFSGAFIPRLVSNIFDKVLSCLFVALILTKLSQKYSYIFNKNISKSDITS